MAQGIVKWFDEKKGYGFISYDNEEIFVHFTGIHQEGFKTLKVNQDVTFDIMESKRGLQATNVQVIEKSEGQ
ncbi:cold-shock protein [Vagococcus xieshaowenii]|uniref:Cold shock domain-containing protein n=1 Tax=Vagococcus xieshaowenii TaxID=2562451 RepID=A0AAJ5EF67_9ENTE|nr:cold shock domain-containing protein [Vagococcus xieshaowenii]QCA28583.1 cold shock domain-containing protein [Vagococcus xieshaowenii]TFZ40609.1 cold shock domain-containing protein [Vagococcus xieshaowenii]